jgi:arginine repressor
MNVNAKLKEDFAEITHATVVQDLYKIQICGVTKTKMEMLDMDALYLKIKSLETCQ